MPVRIERSDAVWTVIHSRPETRNAMDPDSAVALYEAFLAFDTDDTAHVAVFWGEGGAFCSGWDLKRAAALSGAEALDPFDFPDEGEPPMAAMGPSRLELSKPVIAAVAGPAVAGGMELALWADIRVMEETAYMGVYCRRWGIPLIDGGTVRWCRQSGPPQAASRHAHAQPAPSGRFHQASVPRTPRFDRDRSPEGSRGVAQHVFLASKSVSDSKSVDVVRRC